MLRTATKGGLLTELGDTRREGAVMIIKSAGQILMNEVNEAVEFFKSCVTPISDVNERNEAELFSATPAENLQRQGLAGGAK